MHNQANQLELARLKKKLRLMIVALIGCAALIIVFIAAVIFFYHLQPAAPLPKNKAQLNLYLPETWYRKFIYE